MSRRGISRQQQAFESLLDLEADFPVESVQPSRKTRSSRGNSKTRCTDIQFRHPEGSTSTFRTVSREGGLEALHELFGTAVELDIIRDVYGACGGNVESATDALLALTTESLPEALSGAPMAEESSSSSSQDLWDRLAEDVKEIIWRHVAQRDCARAAGTCREFAKHARSVQLGVKTLHLPKGLSYNAITGMVKAHAKATTVCFPSPKSVRSTVPDLEMLAMAIGWGVIQRSPPKCPLEGIDLQAFNDFMEEAHLPLVQDGDIALLCLTLPSVRDWNLKDCSALTDTSLLTLSKHQPQADAFSDSEGDSEEDEEAHGQGRSPAAPPSSSTMAASPAREAVAEAPNSNTGGNGTAGAGAGSRARRAVVQAVDRVVERAQAHAGEVAASPDPASSSPGGGQGWREQRAERGVRRVVLDGCRKITSRGVQALMTGRASAYSLQVLDVSHCTALQDEAFQLNPKGCLRSLRANHCLNLTRLLLSAGSCPALQELSLTHCGQLRSINISAPQLRELRVSSCGSLRELQVACPRLTHLAAAQCRSLLHLGDPFLCPSLSHLNLFGCRQLLSEGVEEVLSACGKLEDLNLDGCTSLRTIRLSGTTNLRHVVLRGCRQLNTASVDGTQLMSLTAVGCTSLQSLRMESRALEVLELGNCAALKSLHFPAMAPLQRQAPEWPDQPPSKVKVRIEGCAMLPAATLQRLQALSHT